jgi:hypothetical protein
MTPSACVKISSPRRRQQTTRMTSMCPDSKVEVVDQEAVVEEKGVAADTTSEKEDTAAEVVEEAEEEIASKSKVAMEVMLKIGTAPRLNMSSVTPNRGRNSRPFVQLEVASETQGLQEPSCSLSWLLLRRGCHRLKPRPKEGTRTIKKMATLLVTPTATTRLQRSPKEVDSLPLCLPMNKSMA